MEPVRLTSIVSDVWRLGVKTETQVASIRSKTKNWSTSSLLFVDHWCKPVIWSHLWIWLFSLRGMGFALETVEAYQRGCLRINHCSQLHSHCSRSRMFEDEGVWLSSKGRQSIHHENYFRSFCRQYFLTTECSCFISFTCALYESQLHAQFQQSDVEDDGGLLLLKVRLSSGGGVGFFLSCWGFGRMFDRSFSVCAFEVEVSSRTSVPLFMPRSVHSG